MSTRRRRRRLAKARRLKALRLRRAANVLWTALRRYGQLEQGTCQIGGDC